jgi:hypothetical protein
MYDNSTPIGGQTSSVKTLIAAINNFPQEWALTPCIGKRNLWPNWNKAKLDRETLIEAIRSQKNHEGKKTAWTGVSIVTGLLSNGVMAIDFDGPAAWKKYLELSGNQVPPFTIYWTSGKAGHFQILLSVPREKWEELKPQKIELENDNKLELRWNQCSTLPPSIHPDTKRPYVWENGADTLIAECPDFILNLMREAPAIELPQKPKPENPTYVDASDKSLVDLLEQEILPRLDAEEFYGSYLKLKSAGKNFKGLCPFHEEKTPSFSITPAEKTFHCFGCGVGGGPVQFIYQLRGGSGSPTGKDFYSVVMELAARVGVQMPDRKFTQNSESKIQKTNNVLQHSTTNNVVPLRPVQNPSISGIEEEIEELLESDLKKSQIRIKISELSQRFRVPSADVWKIYHEQEAEQEQEADLPDIATEIEALLAAHKSSITLTEVLPAGLAQPIEKLAAMLNLRSECYLAALLTQVASLFKVGTETILRRDTDWRCVPNYFAGIVAEVSQLKTPIPKAIIDRPMRTLRERAQKEFEQAQLNYETELNNWQAAKKDADRGPTPKPPRQRIYSFDKTTGEGIIYQQAEFPDQAMMYFCDELAGMLKSGNQYRGGKGSDEEDMLSFWNGTGTTVLRALGVRASVEAVGLSIFGTIQPDVLASLLKDCSDSNGKFARFDFVIQPLAVPNLPEDDSGRFDLTPMLADLYQKIDALPAICFEFDKQAKDYHRLFTLACHGRRVFDEPKQGLRGALGKMPEKVGKLATTIHTLNCVFNRQQVTNQIPRSAVEAAVKFVKFAADQVTTLYTEFSNQSALAPNLMKIIQAAELQGGKITVREARDILRVKQQRPTVQTVREWFSELQKMKHGEVTTVKKSTFFTLATATVTRATVSQTLELERVEVSHNSLKQCAADATINEATVAHRGTSAASHVPQLESLSSKALDTIAASAAHISPPPENSETLMLSCTTESAEFTDEHHAKMLADKMREVIASSNFEGAKEIVKQVNESTSQLRASFWQNLERTKEKNKARLLAFANLSEGTPVKYVGKIEQYVQEELTAYDADGYGGITCLLASGRGFTTWIPTRDLRKKL